MQMYKKNLTDGIKALVILKNEVKKVMCGLCGQKKC